MRILGIDPALKRSGWAIIDHSQRELLECGVISTNIKHTLPIRLKHIFSEMSHILKNNIIDHAVIEMTFVNNNAQSSLLLGHARGVIIATIAQQDISITESTPNHIKKAITGNGMAKKSEIQQMLPLLIKNLPSTFHNNTTYDVSDAIAIALSFT